MAGRCLPAQQLSAWACRVRGAFLIVVLLGAALKEAAVFKEELSLLGWIRSIL